MTKVPRVSSGSVRSGFQLGFAADRNAGRREDLMDISSDIVNVGGVHFDDEASHDERKREYHTAGVLVAQDDTLSARKNSLVDAHPGPNHEVGMRRNITQLDALA
jgi:hypothetical protein